jgi:hypothetical protein
MVHEITHLQTGYTVIQGVTKRCRLSLLTIVPSYKSSDAGGWVGGCGVSANDFLISFWVNCRY